MGKQMSSIKNIIIIFVIIISLFLMFKLFSPYHPENNINQYNKEGFNSPENKYDNKSAYVDPNTGSLIDGPGFEASEIEGSISSQQPSISSNYYFLDDGANGEMSIQHNMCSKSCCSAQWPTPFKQKYDPHVCKNKDKFVPSSIFCNNAFNDSGCLCLTKPQANFLYNRGNNGRELF